MRDAGEENGINVITKALWALCGISLVSWIVGVVFKLFEDVIHIMLAIAAALAAINVVRGLRSRPGPATE